MEREARGTELSAEIIAPLDGNCGTPWPLPPPPPRWGCVSSCFPEANRQHSTSQRCILPQTLWLGLASSQGVHLLCSAGGEPWEHLGWLSLIIAEGSWDTTLLLIYTCGERWLVFWETSHMTEPQRQRSGLLYWPWQLRGYYKAFLKGITTF